MEYGVCNFTNYGFIGAKFSESDLAPIKTEINNIQNNFELYKNQRDSLEKSRKSLEIDFLKSQSKINEDKKDIEKLNSQLIKSQKDLQDAILSVSYYRSEYDNIKNKITEIKSNPIKRSGDDLLNSLKKKLK
jgi:chromosome segregation ATPase